MVVPVALGDELKEMRESGNEENDTGWLDLGEHIKYRKVGSIVFISIFVYFSSTRITYTSPYLPENCRPSMNIPHGLTESIPILGGSQREFVAGASVNTEGIIQIFKTNSSAQGNFSGFFSFPVD